MRYKSVSGNRLIINELLAGILGTFIAYYVIKFIYMFIYAGLNSNSYFIINIFQPILNASAIILVSSLLVYLVGKLNSWHGSYPFALLGSVFGFCVCFLTVYIVTTFKTFNQGSPYLALISGVVYIIIPSFSSVISFNLRKEIKQ